MIKKVRPLVDRYKKQDWMPRLPLPPEGDRLLLDALRQSGSQLSSAHSCSTGLGTCLNASMAGSGLGPTLPATLPIFLGSTWFGGAFSAESFTSRLSCCRGVGPGLLYVLRSIFSSLMDIFISLMDQIGAKRWLYIYLYCEFVGSLQGWL
jgi:hypothetical protein